MNILHELVINFVSIIALMSVIVGCKMLKYSQNKINNISGYRSKPSKKSEESWGFSQKHVAKKSIETGVVMTVVSLILFAIDFSGDTKQNIITNDILIVIFITYLLVKIERALNKKFGKSK
jgi:hypothetical protein